MEGFKIESVLLTGSDRGIGLGLVQQFMGLPHPPQFLFATCRHPDSPEGQVLKEMATRGSNNTSCLVVLQLDVTDPHSIKAAAEEAEKYLAGRGLNLLINNAGIACTTTLASETAQSMAAVYATNTIGPMQVCQAFLPLLKRAAPRSNSLGMSCNKAAIVNMSSTYGSMTAVDQWEWHQDVGYRCSKNGNERPDSPIVGCSLLAQAVVCLLPDPANPKETRKRSKAALNMLTKCQSLGYGTLGILCIALHPGDVKTHLGAEKGALTVDSSARGILEVLSRLSAKDNGTFLDWRGQRVPW